MKKGIPEMKEFTDILLNYVEAEDIKACDEFKKDLGLASFDTVCLSAEINNILGVRCEPADFIMHRTVGEFYNNVIKK